MTTYRPVQRLWPSHRRGAEGGCRAVETPIARGLRFQGCRLYAEATQEIHDQDYEENRPQARADSSASSPPRASVVAPSGTEQQNQQYKE